MKPVEVGIREFRAKLATYLLESDRPIAITRLGDTVGYYIPARRQHSEAELESLRHAAARLDKVLAAWGVKKDNLVRDFERCRKQG